jgi:hypothetical protein
MCWPSPPGAWRPSAGPAPIPPVAHGGRCVGAQRLIPLAAVAPVAPIGVYAAAFHDLNDELGGGHRVQSVGGPQRGGGRPHARVPPATGEPGHPAELAETLRVSSGITAAPREHPPGRAASEVPPIERHAITLVPEVMGSGRPSPRSWVPVDGTHDLIRDRPVPIASGWSGTWPRGAAPCHRSAPPEHQSRGLRTQNSFPSGSASTTHVCSPCPTSAGEAPNPRILDTSAAWSSAA